MADVRGRGEEFLARMRRTLHRISDTTDDVWLRLRVTQALAELDVFEHEIGGRYDEHVLDRLFAWSKALREELLGHVRGSPSTRGGAGGERILGPWPWPIDGRDSTD